MNNLILQQRIREQIKLRHKFGDEIFCYPDSRFYPKTMHNYKLLDNSNEMVWICICGSEFKEAK